MRVHFFLILLLIGVSLPAQESITAEEFQQHLNEEFLDPNKSPLPENERSTFDGLPFFPIQEHFRVEARFVKAENETCFGMPTTTDRRPVYKKFGEAHFELDGETIVLSIYQNQKLIKQKGYENYLFLPFTDLSNGESTYGGGRFIDLRIPTESSIIIDFNKAYNPYCAYNHKYSCPIPPEENRLNISIEAGVMYLEK
jgi:uncharacterized protein (DUF1684 family)